MFQTEVIVIDDSQIDHLIAKHILSIHLGIQKVSYAISAEEALQLINRRGERGSDKCIILLDIKMPGMDGFGFLEEFDRLSSQIKDRYQIYMLSSSINLDDIQRAEDSPYVQAYLQKPLTKQTMSKLKDELEARNKIE